MSRISLTLLAMTVALNATRLSHAVVETIDATVAAEVREFLGPNVVNSDSAFEYLGETTGNLPLMVEVQLTQAETEDAGAGVKTTFADPRLTQLPDPNEFGIALVGFSEVENVSYSAVGRSSETRRVVFTAEEIGASEGTGLTARSYFFLDGLLVLWSEEGSTDLSGTTASVALNVKQLLPVDEQSMTVLEASLTLAGPLGGDVSLTAAGGLIAGNVIQLDISDLVSGLGSVYLAIIPELAIPYTYMAEVQEPFTLEARIEGQISNRPGTGAAVMLGVPLDELASLLDDVVGEGGSEDFEQVLQGLLSSGLVPAKPLPGGDGTTKVTVTDLTHLFPFGSGALCGMLGVESAALSLLLAAMAGLALRSRS